MIKDQNIKDAIVRDDNMREPKFRRCQMVKILHDWAQNIPPRPIENSMWDEEWNCYTYAFPLALIRIEEHELEAVDIPDIDPEEWLLLSDSRVGKQTYKETIPEISTILKDLLCTPFKSGGFHKHQLFNFYTPDSPINWRLK